MLSNGVVALDELGVGDAQSRHCPPPWMPATGTAGRRWRCTIGGSSSRGRRSSWWTGPWLHRLLADALPVVDLDQLGEFARRYRIGNVPR